MAREFGNRGDEREALLAITEALIEISDRAHYAEEMAWRTFAALAKLHPEFANLYDHPEGVQMDSIIASRHAIRENLNRIMTFLGPD